MGILSSVGKALGVSKVVVRRADHTAPGSAEAAIPTLIEKLKALEPEETRRATNARYFEGVISKERMPEFCAEIEAALGEAAKPFGARSDFQDDLEGLVDSKGGIDKGQCLYLRCFEDDGRVAFAALWPWSDGKLVTLKAGIYG